MCNFRLDRRDVERRFGIDFEARFAGELQELEQGAVRHGFVEVDPDAIRVTPRGRLFVRNVCMAFDRYLQAKAAGPVFSRTV
jgi:oxygen-independent coproporphyrinogen-3 oxidase